MCRVAQSHEDFMKQVFSCNEEVQTGALKILGSYEKCGSKILAENKYGKVLVYPQSLLKNRKTSVLLAYNPHEYFINQLLEKNIHYKNGEFELYETYKLRSKNIIVKVKHGLIKASIQSLLKNMRPTNVCALNKTQYFISRAKEIHGDLFDYDQVEYKGNNTKVRILCERHGIFEQIPRNHLSGQGCYLCAQCDNFSTSNWISKAEKSKNFDGFKVYLIECWDENERFFKIGKTYKSVDGRFGYKSIIPYNYEEKVVVNFLSGEACTYYEKVLHKDLKLQKYKPLKNFNGKNECFIIPE